MFYTVLSYLEYDIYRKLTEMYKIDRLLMILLALLSRPGFLCGSKKKILNPGTSVSCSPSLGSRSGVQTGELPHQSDPIGPRTIRQILIVSAAVLGQETELFRYCVVHMD